MHFTLGTLVDQVIIADTAVPPVADHIHHGLLDPLLPLLPVLRVPVPRSYGLLPRRRAAPLRLGISRNPSRRRDLLPRAGRRHLLALGLRPVRRASSAVGPVRPVARAPRHGGPTLARTPPPRQMRGAGRGGARKP
uniref:Uncharacterized protein n=1 Tax=Arundo donax TaxID=35708 RepID=A0A0A9FE31_ARUDO